MASDRVASIILALDNEILVLTVISTNLIRTNHYKSLFLYRDVLREIFKKTYTCSIKLLQRIHYYISN